MYLRHIKGLLQQKSHVFWLFCGLWSGIMGCIVTEVMAQGVSEEAEKARINLQDNLQRLGVPSFLPGNLNIATPSEKLTRLKFVTSVEFPPFHYFDRDGHLAGFAIDLASELCKELKAACTIKAVPFEQLTNQDKKIAEDIIVAGIDSEKRPGLVYSFPVMQFPARFAVKDENSRTAWPENLAGVKIAVANNSSHMAFLQSYFPKAKILPFTDANAARRAFLAGEADLIFGDGLQLSFWLASETANGCCRFYRDPYMDSWFFGKSFRLAVPKNKAGIMPIVNHALWRLQNKGILSRLYLKHIPISLFAKGITY